MTALFSTRFLRGGLALVAAFAIMLPAIGRSQVIINEILANNETTAPLVEIPDYLPEYIELYNASTVDIDLGAEGWTITDNAILTNKYHFPFGTIIYADSFLLLFCDNETNYPGIHVGFSLDAKTGETITLYKRSGGGSVRVTQTSFGIQLPGYSVGRVPGANGDTPFKLNFPTPCGGTIPCLANAEAPFIPYHSTPFISNQFSLKINEWVATNSAGADEDWLEIYNPDPTNIVALDFLVIFDKHDNRFNLPNDNNPSQNGPRPIPALTYIAPLGFAQFFCSGDNRPAANNLNFGISSGNDGPPGPGGVFETIRMYFPNRETVIDTAESHLYLTQRNWSEGRVPDGANRYTYFPNSTPGDANYGPIPEIIINELLSHTDPPLEDAVEFLNVSSNAVNMSHWWMSNGRNTPRKYQFPTNSIVPPGGYLVVYEKDFNTNALGPIRGFTFNSARGDECYIFKADASGELTGYRRGVQFGAAPNGVSFGRYVTSDTNAEFVLMSDLSFGTEVRAGQHPSLLSRFREGRGEANPSIRYNPVVINEIHFHPPEFDGVGGTNDNSIDEFIELRNYSFSRVNLYYDLRPGEDTDFTTNRWKIRGVVDYDFPQDDVPFMGPNSYLLVVNFDPKSNTVATLDWMRTNGVASNAKLYGPYKGKLSNREGNVELYRPDTPQVDPHPDAGLTPQILVDRVHYEDRPPWPSNAVDGAVTIWADGGRASVQRRFSYEYGNDPTNWFVARPTPGFFNSKSHLEVPYFLVHPIDYILIPPRSNIQLSALARGTPPHIEYQWYRNGVAIPGAVSTSYAINSVGAGNIGEYYCVARNDEGSSTSRVATVSIACPFLLSRTGAAFGEFGGDGSVTVTSPEGCPWEVENIPPWVTITSETSFDGTGTFSFTVGPYSGTTVRAAILMVAGQPFRISQSPHDPLRPTVAFTAPASGARVTSPVAIIRGTANDNYEIQRVEVQTGQGAYVPAIGTKAWTNITTLEPGTNWIRVRSIDLAGNISVTNIRSLFYVLPSPLNLTIVSNGWGTVSGATNRQRLEVNRGYTLTATARPGYVFSNWTGDIPTTSATKLQFMMRPNMSIDANFTTNPFAPAKGTYYGLFSAFGAVNHTNSGSFKLTTTDKGTYSASLSVGGKKYSTSGQLDLFGMATNVIPRTGLTPLKVAWGVSLSTQKFFNGSVGGIVSAADWENAATITGTLAWWNASTNPSPYAGKYTLKVMGVPEDPKYPAGDGYGTVTINTAGLLKFTGVLADGTKVSQSVSVGRYGNWYHHFVAYGGRGSTFGYLGVFPGDIGGDLTGRLNWYRPAGPVPKYYTNGFNDEFQLTGSFYRAPVGATNRILQLTNAQIVLNGGNLPVSPSINNVILGLSSKVTNDGPNLVTCTFTLPTGLFSGTYREAGTTRTITFRGAVLQQPLEFENKGYGHFLGTSESGQVLFDKRPMPSEP